MKGASFPMMGEIRKTLLGRLSRLLFILNLPLVLGCPAYGAQDQIAIVIPIIEAAPRAIPPSEAGIMTYLLAQSVRWHFRQNEPSVEKSSAVLVPAQPNGLEIATATKLARINGAQLALVMKGIRQFDGTKIHGVLAIPKNYTDFRNNHLEVLSLSYGTSTLKLDVPSRFTVLPDFYISDRDIKTFGARKYLSLCPVTPSTPCESRNKLDASKTCEILGEKNSSLFETRRLTELGPTIMLKAANGQCFRQLHPTVAVLQKPTIDFVSGVERFFAGDWPQVISLMSSVVQSKLLKGSDIALQANLYMVRSCIRQNDAKCASEYMIRAEMINSRDTRVVKTRIFLEGWNIVNSLPAHPVNAAKEFNNLNALLKLQPSFVRESYTELVRSLDQAIGNKGP
jgi:hypothetical protein